MDHPYFPVLVVFLVGGLFAAAFMGLSSVIGPKKYDKSKFSVYECGLNPVGSARERVDVKFALVALLFILFDLEAVFLFPWAILFRKFVSEGMGLFLFAEMAVFIGVLAIGLYYVWKKGALDWK